MRNISLDSIATYLKAQPTVAAIFGTRITAGEPKGDEQAGKFLILNVISQDRGEVDCMARVEFRFAAHNQSVTKTDLTNAHEVVSQVLCKGPFALGSFKVYSIEEGSDFFASRDDKNRNLLVCSYLVRFIWSN